MRHEGNMGNKGTRRTRTTRERWEPKVLSVCITWSLLGYCHKQNVCRHEYENENERMHLGVRGGIYVDTITSVQLISLVVVALVVSIIMSVVSIIMSVVSMVSVVGRCWRIVIIPSLAIVSDPAPVPALCWRHRTHALACLLFEARVRHVLLLILAISKLAHVHTVAREHTPDPSTRVVDAQAPAVIKLLQDRHRVAQPNLNLVCQGWGICCHHRKRAYWLGRRHLHTLLDHHVRLVHLGVRVVVVELGSLLKKRCGQVLFAAVATERDPAQRKHQETTNSSQANEHFVRHFRRDSTITIGTTTCSSSGGGCI